MLGLPTWTLSARLEGEVLEFSLGDGRRLAWRSRRPAALLKLANLPMPAADFLGADLATQLAQSATRVLNVQCEANLDGVRWEHLMLGTLCLGEHFALSRQMITGTDSAPFFAEALSDDLAVAVFQDDELPSWLSARKFSVSALDESDARQALLAAQVLVLREAEPSQLIERNLLPRQPCLWVMHEPQTLHQLGLAFDAGVAVLVLGPNADPNGTSLNFLLQQLGTGLSIGETVRSLHRRAAPAPLDLRLYGDPAIRFVRTQAPTSRRQVTSLSFDIVGSTTLLQKLGDEAYAEMLASLHTRCTAVVRVLGGQPDDPQGDDGVMCYFGHPLALEDAAVQAVDAGLKIIGTVAELGVSVRVGIATGLVAIKAAQPVGLSIHLAARLQQTAAPGTVLTSESTRRLVAHAFDLQVLEARPGLKGIDDLEDFYRVLGPRQDATLHRLERQLLLTPMVGRSTELERLHTVWRQVGMGTCQLSVVRADAGMGKSRLVREFRHQLTQAGVKVLECRCRADASASPYLTLAEALRRWLDIGPDTVAAEALQRLSAALPAKARNSEPLAVLAAFLGLAPQPTQTPPGGVRQRLLGLLLDWFVVFAKDRPCCLIVEDWHWVDPSMREFVEHIAQRKGGPGLLVVVTIRGDKVPAPLTFDSSDLIELVGLAPADARELVSHVCAGAQLPAGVLKMLATRGDGVPLFLEEAAHMALELGADRLNTGVRAEDSVPASLQDLLMARLDGLGPAKPVAQVAAVLGREFSLALLLALLETGPFALDAVTLAERLEALIASGLVRPEGPGQFAFRHALIRDAAYASLWTRDRHALHARVVELLQQRWPELAVLQPELLALHQTEAGLHSEALAQWELAASSAAARSAELEAISHLRQALAVLTRTETGTQQDRTALRLQLLLAARLIATEGYGAESVLQAYLEAERLGKHLGDESVRFKVEMGLEAYRFMRADFDLALEHGRWAAAFAQRSGDIRQQLHAKWGLACTLFHQGQLRATMREMESALAAYTPAMHTKFGIQDPGVMCLAYSSWGLWEMARPDAALARINHAVKIANEFEHKFSQAVALAYGVSIELLRGETDAAMTRAAICINVCDDAGFPVWLAITRCMRGRMLCERGQFDEGLSEMRAGYAQWLATGAMVSQPLYLALQAEGLMLAGQLEEAAACVNQGLAITSRFGERQLEAELCRLGGEVALIRNERAEAESKFKAAYASATRQHKLGFALRAGTSLARLWVGDGREDRARRLLVPLVARWQEGLETRDVKAARALCESVTSPVEKVEMTA
jgi:predicted ATPase/class 3 adenylate cyclase